VAKISKFEAKPTDLDPGPDDVVVDVNYLPILPGLRIDDTFGLLASCDCSAV